MSLATTCPQCKTSFKVVPDQLKLRRGLVRCGACRHVFSGVDHLRYVEDPPLVRRARGESGAEASRWSPPEADAERVAPAGTAQEVGAQDVTAPGEEAGGPRPDTPDEAIGLAPGAGATPGTGSAPQAHGAPETGPAPQTDAIGQTGAAPGPGAAPAPGPAPHIGVAREDGSGHESGPHESDATPEERARSGESTAPDGHTQTYPDTRPLSRPGAAARADPDQERQAVLRLRTRAQGSPFRDTLPQPVESEPGQESAREWLDTARGSLAATPTEDDAVDFFAGHRRARGFSTRSSVFAAVAAAVLALALVLQLAIGARDWLAARIPALRPVLAAALAPAGLTIRAPRQIDALTIESFELQSAGGDGMLSMNALLRNAAGHAVRWPAMELSLSDGGGSTVVRKVLMPEDYLGAAAREHDAIGPKAEWPVRVALQADGIEAAGYSVKLFYP